MDSKDDKKQQIFYKSFLFANSKYFADNNQILIVKLQQDNCEKSDKISKLEK